MPSAASYSPGAGGVSWRRRSRALLTLVAMLGSLSGVLAGCGAEPDTGECAEVQEAPADEVALLPAGLSFDAVGPVTEVVRDDSYLTVRAVTDRPIDDATVRIQDAVTRAGYRPAGMDNEGFEAEVFFVSGTYAAGQAVVRRGDCAGRWDVELVLLDPDATRSPTPSGTPS
ncbi:MAG: hypothetical protein ACRCY8_17945 [Dermatophilaceae bacterium]